MRKYEWSLKYPHCVKCGLISSPHKARGYCENCYQKITEKKNSSLVRSKGTAHKIFTIEYLQEEYVKNEKSLGDIAKNTGCSRQYVYKKLLEFGIPVRTKSTARTIAYSKDKLSYSRIDSKGEEQIVKPVKHVTNEYFFSKWTNEMAYVLGLIYTDGCLDPGRILDPSRKTTLTIPRLTLWQKDKELLEKVLQLMNSNSPILHRPKTNYSGVTQGEVYYFHINSSRIYRDLLTLGLKPNKSKDIEFPNIPDEYLQHFIRGCWDGDGSIFLDKRDNNIVAHFVSGSEKFILGLAEKLESKGLSKRTIYIAHGKSKQMSKYYYFKFSGENVYKLYRLFYENVPSLQYLERKYRVFHDYFAKKEYF